MYVVCIGRRRILPTTREIRTRFETIPYNLEGISFIFMANIQHFEEWEEDQYDFHTYSFRKGPIRDYIKLLSWEDRLRSHPYYVRCARNAIRIYVQLYDDPRLATDTPAKDGIDDAERKKAAKKAKKAAKKQEEQTPENKDVKKDDDPRGEILVKTEKPLDEAVRFLKPLQELSPCILETQLLAFDVHFRRGDFLEYDL